MSPLRSTDQTGLAMFRYIIRYLPVILPFLVRFVRSRRSTGAAGSPSTARSRP